MYTLGDIPLNGAEYYPDKEAVVFEDTRLTYKELNARVNRFAHALGDLGYKKGDGLAVMADNCAKYLEVYFGAAKLGVIVTPLNVRLGDEEIIYVVNDSEISLLIVGDGYEERLNSIKDKFENVTKWIALDNECEGFLDYETLLEHSSDAEPDKDLHDVQEDDMAILMYTGGTTGLPKGVMLSHRNAIISGIAGCIALGFGPDDSTCFVLPIFHVSWWPVLAILIACGTVCINRKPNLDAIFQLIQDEKCTHMNLVPTIYGWMVEYPNVDKYDLTSLRVLSYAGSPFPVEVLKRCIRKFGRRFAQGYGATETAGAPISMLHWDDHYLEGPKSKHLGSAGKPSTWGRVKVVDSDDNEVPVGERGEICATGKHIMLGYWKNPEGTAEVLKDGWYHTGDIGFMDYDGYIYMTDRKADMIITGGENVYPKEVEDVIYGHPAVQECAVVSAPDLKWGEVAQAVIVLKEGKTASEKEIIAHCRNTLAPYKCPKRVSFWDTIPKTIVGKIMKKEIKATFWEGHDRSIN